MQQPHCPHKNRQITVYREVPEVLLLREATLESTSEWDAQLACAMSWKCEDCGYEESHQDWRKADPATRQIYQQARSFVAMDDPFPLSALQEEAVPLATKTPHSPGAITLVREDDLAILYERGHLKVSAWRLSGPSGKRFRKPRLTPVGNWQVLEPGARIWLHRHRVTLAEGECALCPPGLTLREMLGQSNQSY